MIDHSYELETIIRLLGAGIAKHLAKAVAAVAVDYASSRAGADRVVAEIEALGGRAIAVQLAVRSQPKSDIRSSGLS